MIKIKNFENYKTVLYSNYPDEGDYVIIDTTSKGRELKEFINNNKDQKALIFEIPLLFEKNYQNSFNKIITTYCSEKTQRERALRRKNIDNNRLNFIMKQQMPSNIKARLTDYLVYTDFSYQYTRDQVEQILAKEKI